MSRSPIFQKCKVIAIRSALKLSKPTFFGQFSTDTKITSVESLQNESTANVTPVGATSVASTKKATRTQIKPALWTKPAAIVRGDKELQVNGDATADNAKINHDDKSAAERAWLDSGYIEYMDNQRDKGWKT